MFKPPDFWKRITIITLALYPFSIFYSWISRARYRLQVPKRYRCKVIPAPICKHRQVTRRSPICSGHRSSRLGLFNLKSGIICIGNVTLGGAGKTPLAIAIGKQLIAANHKIAYACKNYGGIIKGPVRVTKKHNAIQVIDEAILLSKTAPTYVARKRRDAVRSACETAEIVISDDGFQNNSFHKDLSILVVPEDKNFGNGFIFPAGPLREHLKSGLKKADLVCMANETGDSHQKSRAVIERCFDERKIFRTSASYKFCGFHREKYIAFCGIACPENFFATLEKLKIKTVGKVSFPDHHTYSESELWGLFHRAKELNAGLITTEKDLVRLRKSDRKRVSYLTLTLEIIEPFPISALD